MKDLGFFLGMFAVIVILAIAVGEKRETASTTPPVDTANEEVWQHETPTYTTPDSSTPPVTTPTPQPELTPEEVERKVASIYRELDALREDLRKTRLSEPASSYRTLVRLSVGSARDTEAEREYLVLRADSLNPTGVNISDWYLESYVTDESASIPRGDRIMDKWRSPQSEDIVLMPGETAYLITGDSPINTSFRENRCTGYLAEEDDFSPSLSRSCPRPMDELERFGSRIDLDDDDCYEFLERLGTCVTPEDETYTRSKVGGACSVFIENTFNYNDCVRIHRYDPFFDDTGNWRVYLGERNELWRSEREIIRLMDEADRVIAVIEY
jgi:hypothetical protein